MFPDLGIGPDVDAARVLAAWIALGDAVLTELRETYAAHDPSTATIWPEHFDLGCELGDVNAGTRATFGAAPGDGYITQPYLYVSPHDAARKTGPFSAYPFGAAISYDELNAAGDAKGAALDFVLEGAALVLGQP